MTPRLRQGVLRSLPGTVIPGLVTYGAFLAIEHLAGSSTLGYISLAWVVANIGAAATGLGPSHAALRSIAEAPDCADHIRARYRTIVVRRSLVLAVLVVAAGLVTTIFSTAFGIMVVVAAPWLLGQAMVLFETETLKAIHQFGLASAVLALRATLSWGAAVAGAAVIGGTAATVLPAAVVGIAVAAVVSRAHLEPSTDDDLHYERSIGRPVSQLSVASYALGYGDRFIVQALLGPMAVATYTLGYQLGEGAMELVTAPVTAAALPKLVHEWQAGDSGRDQARSLARRLSLAILGLAVAAPLVVFAIAPTGIFDLISGDPDLPAIVAIVAAAVGLQGLTRVSYALLLAQGRTRTALNNFMVVGLLSLVLAPLLTWQFDLIGTAVATMIAYGSLAIITVITARQEPNLVGSVEAVL